MKNRLRAILLAAGLTLSMGGICAFAENATEAVTEAVTESVQDTEVQEADGMYAAYYDEIKENIAPLLIDLSGRTEEELDEIIETSQNSSDIVSASNWKNVREELGNFVEIKEQEVFEEGDVVTVVSNVVYDGVDDHTEVFLTYKQDLRNLTVDVSWEVKYPFSKLLEQAGLNTLMGLGIVFAVLIFLSLIISQLHWIPDLLEGRKKKEEPKQDVPAAPAAVPAPAGEEEDLTDDLELAAVIAAAIAAFENTSTDGFVVRSIKKANRRK